MLGAARHGEKATRATAAVLRGSSLEKKDERKDERNSLYLAVCVCVSVWGGGCGVFIYTSIFLGLPPAVLGAMRHGATDAM